MKKIFWANLQRTIELSTQKIVIKLSAYGFGIRDPRSGIRDPGSEIRDPEKIYSGFRILVQGPKRHRIPDLDPQQSCRVRATREAGKSSTVKTVMFH